MSLGKTELPPAIATQPEEDIDIEDTDQPKALADDEPVDTLVESLERDITEVWSYRDMFPDADSLGLDNEKVNTDECYCFKLHLHFQVY